MTDILSSECESATRTVTLENDTDLVVKDIVKAKYNKAADVRWTMVTRAIPTVEGNRIVLQGASKKLYLKVTRTTPRSPSKPGPPSANHTTRATQATTKPVSSPR